MTHTARETGRWQHTLSIEVEASEVEARLERAARELQRRAAMPGFRRGKVPLERVRQEFAAHIEQEFLERFLPEATGRALADAKLEPVVPPTIRNVQFTPGQPLRFDAVVDVAPVVEARDYRGLPLTRRTRPVDEAAVEAVLEGLREEAAVFADLDRPAGRGDVVLLDSQRLDANGRRLAGTRVKATRIQLGAPGLLPDLENGLLGAGEGQERTLTVAYPADYRQSEVAGKTVRYVVRIRKIQEKKLRPLDDTFARELFRLDSLDALRARVRHNLETEEADRVRRELEGAVVEELVRRNPFDLPERLVGYMLDQVIREQTGGREAGEDLRRQLEEHYRAGVERSLRREVLLGAVARQESLSVTDAEVAAEIDRMAAADPRQASRVRARYASPERRQGLRETVLERKAMEFVIGAAEVREDAAGEPLVVPAGR